MIDLGCAGGLVAKSCLTLRPHGLKPTKFLRPWDSPGKNTGVGCHFLLQGIFLTQESNPGLQHCRQILNRLSYQGSPNLGCMQVKIRSTSLLLLISSKWNRWANFQWPLLSSIWYWQVEIWTSWASIQFICFYSWLLSHPGSHDPLTSSPASQWWNLFQSGVGGYFLAVQWLRLHLPMQACGFNPWLGN